MDEYAGERTGCQVSVLYNANRPLTSTLPLLYTLIMKRTIVLAILDGWGIGHHDSTNPINLANPVNINYIKRNYLAGALQASGIAVGLPWGEEGNSEVGHLTIGAGKIIYQHYPRISLAIKNGDFFQNKVLKSAFNHAIKNNSGVNLIGLLTEGNVHASFEHLEALIKYAKLAGVTKLNIHIETDGKDSSQKSAPNLIKKLQAVIKENTLGVLASISGRFYALDRDDHYDRTERAYVAMTGQAPKAENIETWLEQNYKKNLDDQFIEPATLLPENCIKENDAIIFFDFREDSVRQLAEAFILPDFDKFSVIKNTNLKIVTFTQYTTKFNCAVAFPQDVIEKPIGAVLAENNKIQLRITETEKYAHITYFFNGLHESPYQNEYRVLIPSQNIARHDEHPEMMALEITSRAIQAIEEHSTDFILINYANADLIAHTGNFEAGIKAINILDQQIRRLLDCALANDAILIITSDHGNIEQMADPITGLPETKHNLSPVPIYIVGREFVSIKTDVQVAKTETEIIGVLSDIAPTILEITGLPQPPQMTGESLLRSLL